jgi:hypothetical protein
MATDLMVGRRIKITDKKHPHSGETGVIKDIKYVEVTRSVGIEVALENCTHGCSGCFVFQHHKFEIL